MGCAGSWVAPVGSNTRTSPLLGLAAWVSLTTSLLTDVDTAGPAHSSRAGTTRPVVFPDWEGPMTSTDARGSAAIIRSLVDAERDPARLRCRDVELLVARRGRRTVRGHPGGPFACPRDQQRCSGEERHGAEQPQHRGATDLKTWPGRSRRWWFMSCLPSCSSVAAGRVPVRGRPSPASVAVSVRSRSERMWRTS